METLIITSAITCLRNRNKSSLADFVLREAGDVIEVRFDKRDGSLSVTFLCDNHGMVGTITDEVDKVSVKPLGGGSFELTFTICV